MTRKSFGKVAVLMGGPSAEREVSLKSGNAVLAALKRKGVDAQGMDADESTLRWLEQEKIERAFIALHGRWGEDGVIQGALEVLGIPYTGSGVLGSALGMDKLRSKYLWSAAGIPAPAYAVLEAGIDLNQVIAKLDLPIFVKPVREGSSLGISKAKTLAELKAAWEMAAKYDDLVIAERFMEGAELTCAVLGDQALPLIKIETDREFYDYEAKYILDNTRYLCPCGGWLRRWCAATTARKTGRAWIRRSRSAASLSSAARARTSVCSCSSSAAARASPRAWKTCWHVQRSKIVSWAGTCAKVPLSGASSGTTIASAATGLPSRISQSAADAALTLVSIGSFRVSNKAWPCA